MGKEADPLDGFRGRQEDAYEKMEEEVRAWRSVANNDIDLELLQDVVRCDNLIEELKDESSTLQRLCTHAAVEIGEACKAWVEADDPAKPAVVALHRNARAARLLLNWVEQQIRIGKESEHQMLMREYEDE